MTTSARQVPRLFVISFRTPVGVFLGPRLLTSLTEQLRQHGESQLASAYQSGTLSAFLTTKPPPLDCCLEAALGIHRCLVIGVDILSSCFACKQPPSLAQLAWLPSLLQASCPVQGRWLPSTQLPLAHRQRLADLLTALRMCLCRFGFGGFLFLLLFLLHLIAWRLVATQQRLSAFDECSFSNSGCGAAAAVFTLTSIAMNAVTDWHVRQ